MLVPVPVGGTRHAILFQLRLSFITWVFNSLPHSAYGDDIILPISSPSLSIDLFNAREPKIILRV